MVIGERRGGSAEGSGGDCHLGGRRRRHARDQRLELMVCERSLAAVALYYATSKFKLVSTLNAKAAYLHH